MLRPLGTLEQEIMDILWKKKEGSVRDVFEVLKNGKSIAYTTVLTVMNRLVEKGCLRRKPDGNAFLYIAVQTQEKFLGTTIKKFLNNLSKDFGKELVARQFAEGIESLDPKIAGELLKAYKKQ
ncbi:MAG: BlaI/MecI/CopY family transcriptional regulator [Patescibacteria group bacterium]